MLFVFIFVADGDKFWFVSRASAVLVCILGSKDGENESAASHQCDLGSIQARCHMWVKFVVVSRLAPRIFLRILWFSSLLKMNISKFQFHLEPARKPGLM